MTYTRIWITKRPPYRKLRPRRNSQQAGLPDMSGYGVYQELALSDPAFGQNLTTNVVPLQMPTAAARAGNIAPEVSEFGVDRSRWKSIRKRVS